MKKFVGLLIAAILLFGTPALAQQAAGVEVKERTDTISSNSDGVGKDGELFEVRGNGAVGVQIIGSGTFEVTFSVSQDGTNWETRNLTPTNSTSATTTASAAGGWEGSVAGWRYFRAITTSYTSGAPIIRVRTTPFGGGSSGGAGVGGGGDFTIAAYNASFGTAGAADSQVQTIQGIASMTPVQVSDGGGSLTVDGAVTVTDGAGALNVIVDSGDVTSNGLSIATEASLTTVVTNTDRTADNLDTLLASLGEDAIQANSVIASGPQGMLEAKDIDGSALPNVVTEGQSIRAAGTLSGAALTTLVHEDGLSSPIVNEDSAEAASMALLGIATVRRDTAASSAGTSGDMATANTDASGLLWTRSFDPCTSKHPTTVPISVAADTAVISASASNYTWICGGTLVASAAEVVSIWEGTGTACGTGSAALVGSTTEANGMSFAANGGTLVIGPMAGISTNVDVCVRLNGTSRVSGFLSVVQVPY
jgi:hypothetical protein